MIWAIDLLFVFFTAGYLMSKNVSLGILILLVNLSFLFQLGKSSLLLGENKRETATPKRIKAAVLAILFSTPLWLIFDNENAKDTGVSFLNAMNDDLFPVFIGICLLSSLFMISIVAEKRKR